jgi:two-component system NarL family sensor kinase
MQTTQPLVATRGIRVEFVRARIPALIAAVLLVGAGYLGLRLGLASDGLTGSYVTASWGERGLQVQQAADAGGAIRDGDVVTAVAGRPLADWFAGTLDPAAERPSLGGGASVGYTVERKGSSVATSVVLEPYPALAVLLENWSTLLWLLAMAAVGSYLYLRRPNEAATRALAILGTAVLASTVPWMMGLGPADLVRGGALPILYLLATFPIYLLFWSATLHFSLVFPRPLAHPPLQGRLVRLAYLVPLAAQAAWAAGSLPGAPNLLAWIGGWTAVQLVLVPGLIAATLAAIWTQWRRSDAADRERLRWISGASAMAAVGVLVGWFLPQALTGQALLPWSAVGLPGLAFPVALGVAVGRHGLFGIETLIQRSLVYGGLTAGVVAVYAVSVIALGLILPGDRPYAVTLLATGIAALVALPLRDRLQRRVSRLLYGDRDEPYRAIARLGERLEASLDPQLVLPMVAETVAEALRLPYVGIELQTESGVTVAAAHGSARGALERLPLTHRGEQIGWLALAPRAAEEGFGAADRALLAELARQASAAAHSVRLTAELLRSRQELVTTREEERRRLRRDLHDGVGPALAGSLMKLEAARATGSDADLDRLLAELADQTRRTIDDVRRVASNLRPPALDQLGLVPALEQDAARLSSGRLDVSVRAPGALPALPAAVEVAAYRIGLEALANVAHHAEASRAVLELRLLDDELLLEVRDDGRGMGEGGRRGIGLTSMRERAEELGGRLKVDAAPEGGVRIAARLPLGNHVAHA